MFHLHAGSLYLQYKISTVLNFKIKAMLPILCGKCLILWSKIQLHSIWQYYNIQRNSEVACVEFDIKVIYGYIRVNVRNTET